MVVRRIPGGDFTIKKFIFLGLLLLSSLAFAEGRKSLLLDNDTGDSPGKTLFQAHCSMCHDQGVPKAPRTRYLKMMPAETLYRALTEGAMKAQAQGLKQSEIKEIASYLSGQKPDSIGAPKKPLLHCANNDKPWFDYAKPPIGIGWGIDEENTHYIPARAARLTPQQVTKLKPKWVFGFPGAIRARSQPIVAGGALFVGSNDGTVYALDAKTGCVHWEFHASAEVRTAIAITSWDEAAAKTGVAPTLFFGDFFANAYGVNALTGEPVWKTKIDDHSNATITGSPTWYRDKDRTVRVYFPVSSNEVVTAADPNYSCCSFRGSVVALNGADGDVLWKTHTISSPLTEQYKNIKGVPQMGPSGASVWNSPTIDEKRGVLYFGTGNNYSFPAEGHSDSIFAVGLTDGHVEWVTQVTSGDVHNVSCVLSGRENCKGKEGPDFDFGASPILLRSNGEEIIVAGQKSGDLTGLNPDKKGQIVWHTKVGEGSGVGGVHFGIAAEGRTIFAPIHDPDLGKPINPGVSALDGFTGKFLWKSPLSAHCKEKNCLGYSAAITTINGVVFACARDGRCRAFDSGSGRVIWEFNTAQKFTALNGSEAKGGGISGPAPIAADGMLYINSGYLALDGSEPGNVLIAFSPE